MTAIAAVLFDLDDTLLDAESAWRLGVRHLLTHRISGAVGSAQAEAAWGEVFDTWFDRFLTGEISLADSRAGRMRDWAALLDMVVPEGAELEWFDSYLDGYRQGWALFPDAATTLAALAGLPLALVTNGDGQQQREKVAALTLDATFDAVLVSSEVGAHKPQPHIFLEAAARLGVPPERCLMVGDRLESDVSGALAAGMQAAWLQRRGGPQATTIPPAGLAGRFTTIRTLDEVVCLVTVAASQGAI